MNEHTLKTHLIDALALAEIGMTAPFEVQAFAQGLGITVDDVQEGLRQLRTGGDIDGLRSPGTLDVASPYLLPSAQWRWSLMGAKHHLPVFDAMAQKVHAHLREHEQATAETVKNLLHVDEEETQRYLKLMKWGNSIHVAQGPEGRISNISRK